MNINGGIKFFAVRTCLDIPAGESMILNNFDLRLTKPENKIFLEFCNANPRIRDQIYRNSYSMGRIDYFHSQLPLVTFRKEFEPPNISAEVIKESGNEFKKLLKLLRKLAEHTYYWRDYLIDEVHIKAQIKHYRIK